MENPCRKNHGKWEAKSAIENSRITKDGSKTSRLLLSLLLNPVIWEKQYLYCSSVGSRGLGWTSIYFSQVGSPQLSIQVLKLNLGWIPETEFKTHSTHIYTKINQRILSTQTGGNWRRYWVHPVVETLRDDFENWQNFS